MLLLMLINVWQESRRPNIYCYVTVLKVYCVVLYFLTLWSLLQYPWEITRLESSAMIQQLNTKHFRQLVNVSVDCIWRVVCWWNQICDLKVPKRVSLKGAASQRDEWAGGKDIVDEAVVHLRACGRPRPWLRVSSSLDKLAHGCLPMGLPS